MNGLCSILTHPAFSANQRIDHPLSARAERRFFNSLFTRSEERDDKRNDVGVSQIDNLHDLFSKPNN